MMHPQTRRTHHLILHAGLVAGDGTAAYTDITEDAPSPSDAP